MIKLNKTTEYALIALHHLTRQSGMVSAREVSEKYLLPYDITAKTLQKLKDIGWIESTSGSKGGYRLKTKPETVSFAKFLETFEGYQAIVACCMTGPSAQSCDLQSACEVRPFLSNLNAKVFHFLHSIPMNEIIADQRGESMKLPIYLDFQATTPVDSEVLKTMIPYFTEKFGNASSRHHEFGWTADSAIENAREKIATLIQAQPHEIIFTSGATESNNLAIIGGARSYRDRGRHVICSSVEHASVLSAVESLKMEGFEVTILPVDREGLVGLEALKNAVRVDTILVSIIHANNEVGSINQIQQLAEFCKSKNILFHTDASQSAGKIPFLVSDLSVDLVSLSSHKIYGPKGVGALYVRSKKPKIYLDPILHGGGHEMGLRAGTLNVPGIVGFARALEISCTNMNEESARVTALRDRLLHGLRQNVSGIKLNGSPSNRIPGNLNVFIPGALGSALMMAHPEIAFSSSSACSEADGKPSHVLREMGLSDEQAACCIRFGIGRTTSEEEIDYVIEKISKTAIELRQLVFEVDTNKPEEMRL